MVNVIYDNADVQMLRDGNHPPPYCIVVEIPTFNGFVQKKNPNDERFFPFSEHRQWVPIYRKRFAVKTKDLPSWVRKKQLEKDCYRVQFPLDLASNITAHRAQGQTMSNCLVSVDLNLESPDRRLPPEISSLMYVACTRVTALENLFVNSIFPSVWDKLGKTQLDNHRRNVEQNLRQAAEMFAASHGKLNEVQQELSCTADYGNTEDEWHKLQQNCQPPLSKRESHGPCIDHASCTDFHVSIGDVTFDMLRTPVLSERYIGIDQGVRNFGIVVVQKKLSNVTVMAQDHDIEERYPTIVAA